MGVQNPTSSWQELLARDRLENDINRQRHAASLTVPQFQWHPMRMRLSGYFLGFDRETGPWDPNLPNICSKGDISDTDLMQLCIFPLGSFPLARICRTPEQRGVGVGMRWNGIGRYFWLSSCRYKRSCLLGW
jgi:hypothetical protein